MKKILAVATVLAGFSINAQAATAPVQRIDVVNLIGDPTALTLQSPITVKFFTSSGAASPCYTATLPYDGAATFYAGTGLACSSKVVQMSVTPGTSPGSNQVVYAANTSITLVGKYNTQIEVIPDSTAPVFSSTTGAVTTKGTVKGTVQESD